MERGGASAGTVLLGLTYQLDYLRREGADEGAGMGQVAGHGGVENEALRGQVHTGSLNLSVGLTSWFTVGALFPFTYKRQDVEAMSGEVVRATGGIGDPLLLVKMTLWGHDAVAPGALRLGVTGGVKLPLGRDGARDDFGRLPPGFQVSSGAVDLLAGAYASLGVAARTQLMASLIYRHSFENSDGYAFGDGVAATLDVQAAHLYPLTITGGLRLTGSLLDQDRGKEVAASSTLLMSGHLGLAFYITPELFLHLDGLVPFYWRVEGGFLTNRFTGVLGVTVIL